MSLDTLLRAEKTRLEEEKQGLQEEIAAAKERLQEIQSRLHHVEGLLGTTDTNETVFPQIPSMNGRSLTDIAEEILAERSREPMHYKDLAHEVQTRGGTFSGENVAALLNARLVNDERFVRPVRKGFYALRRDYPNAKNVGARKRRRNSD
ncbi:MAG: hypothetical protein F4X83_11825 [Chloroflexi bacterium]|nr:hypothetical protein [Chloroflexota bacterium]